MKKIKKKINVILTILLITSLFGFIVLNSISSAVNKNNVEDIFDNIISGSVDSGINLDEQGASNLYYALKADCSGKEIVRLDSQDGNSIDLNCKDIDSSGKSGLKDLIKLKIKEKAFERFPLESISGKIFWMDVVKWILAVLSFVLIFGMILFIGSFPFILFGISGIVAGFPFFLVGPIKSSLESIIFSKITQDPVLQEIIKIQLGDLIGKITANLFFGFLSLFLLGVILAVVGIVIKFIKKNEK